jgi:hypothetical protein
VQGIDVTDFSKIHHLTQTSKMNGTSRTTDIIMHELAPVRTGECGNLIENLT